MATTTTAPPAPAESLVPEFIERLKSDYRANIAHTFIVHGNINDFTDGSGTRGEIQHALSQANDSEVQLAISRDNGTSMAIEGRPMVLAFYSLTEGLTFAHYKSREKWETMMKEGYKDELDPARVDANGLPSPGPLTGLWRAYEANIRGVQPLRLDQAMLLLNLWFRLSKRLLESNRAVRMLKTGLQKPEITFSVAFYQSDLLFHNSESSEQLGPIAYIRSWALDSQVGERNRIILITRYLNDIDAGIRIGDSGVRPLLIRRPNIEERHQFLTNYDRILSTRAQKGMALVLNGHPVDGIALAEGFTLHDFANLSAGLSRKQMEMAFMMSRLKGESIGPAVVSSVKKAFIEEEYGTFLDFVEPTFGFNEIGGHDGIKAYARRKIISKLKSGDRTTCSSGILLVGPPGTGKTQLALAAAYESGLNVILANFGNLFGGIVGETEKNIKRFFEAVEAASPCIVIGDELDNSVPQGRAHQGDGGVSSRMMSSVMQWLSDSTRKGKIVFWGISNRPDLLDSAFIRSGRIDAILPALPPIGGDKPDVRGRAAILDALCKKHKLGFEQELKESGKTKDNGIGLLLYDSRVWTGAEMEVVLKEAFDNADEDGRRLISVKDWNNSMDDCMPNTRDVEAMTDLALLYTNNRKYVHQDWRPKLESRDKLRSQIRESYGIVADDLSSDRE